MTDKYLEAPKPTLGEAELRKYIDDRFGAIDGRLEAGDVRMQTIEQKVDDNTAVTRDIHEFLTAMRSGFKVLGWLGIAAKWVASVAGAIGAVWALVQAAHHGAPPHSK